MMELVSPKALAMYLQRLTVFKDMPSLSTKSKEHHEYQDMYRRNLAAFWTAQPGELKADECIENIFAGGDGWGKRDDPNHLTVNQDQTRNSSDRRETHNLTASTGFSNRSAQSSNNSSRFQPRAYSTPSSSGVSGRASLEQHANNMKAEAEASKSAQDHEVDEFDLREDLKSWKISAGLT